MPLLSKRRQVVAVEETVGGTLASGMTTAANAGFVLTDASATLDIEAVERNVLRESLTPVKTVPGQQAANINLTTEVAGSANGTAVPKWGRFMEGCGFESKPLTKLNLDTWTAGPFHHGETVTGATSSATGVVVMDTHEGATEMYIHSSSGTWGTGETITGDSSDASVTLDGTTASVSGAGHAFIPVSNVTRVVKIDVTTATLAKGSLIEGDTTGTRAIVAEDVAVGTNAACYYYPVRGAGFSAGETCTVLYDASAGGAGVSINSTLLDVFFKWPSLSMRFIEDGQAVTMTGSRGSVSFNFEVNRPVTATFSYRGSLNSTDDQALLAGVTADAPASPPIWQGSAIGYAPNESSANELLADELEPCLTALQIDMGVTLSDRRCAAAATGLEEVLGTARAGTGSIDPEVTLESDIPWLANLKNGTTTRLRVPLGSTAGNKFTFFMPGVQLSGASYGDRDGIATYDLPFNLTGGYHHNVSGSATNPQDVYGGDNELVIVYHTV